MDLDNGRLTLVENTTSVIPQLRSDADRALYVASMQSDIDHLLNESGQHLTVTAMRSLCEAFQSPLVALSR